MQVLKDDAIYRVAVIQYKVSVIILRVFFRQLHYSVLVFGRSGLWPLTAFAPTFNKSRSKRSVFRRSSVVRFGKREDPKCLLQRLGKRGLGFKGAPSSFMLLYVIVARPLNKSYSITQSIFFNFSLLI